MKLIAAIGMNVKMLGLVAAMLTISATANAAPNTVSFSFDSIATGSFTYDSSKDGNIIGWGDVSAFELQFAGLTTSLYDLAFVNSGNDSVYRVLSWNSATDSFVNVNIAGFPLAMSDIKSSFSSGFALRTDLRVIRDYAAGGDQYYSVLKTSVDRSASSVPVPSTVALLSLSLGGLGWMARRKQA